MMVALLFYGYATGVFSSRKLERETYDSVALRYVAANRHPDHDTIANFRKRFLKELSALFVQILSVAQQMGVLKLGKVSLDGTKVHANASKHSALSWEHASKIEAQLQAEVEQLMRLADEADGAEIPDGMSVPEELQRREERLAAIAQAKAADRGARGRAVCPGAGGVRTEDGGAQGAGGAHGPQARRARPPRRRSPDRGRRIR